VLGSQLLPRVGGCDMYCTGVAVSCGSSVLKLNGESRSRHRSAIDPMKRDPDKALSPARPLPLTSNSMVPLPNWTPRKYATPSPGLSLRRRPFLVPCAEATHACGFETTTPRARWFLLAGDAGSGKEDDKRGPVHRRSFHSYAATRPDPPRRRGRAGRMPARSPTPIRMATQYEGEWARTASG